MISGYERPWQVRAQLEALAHEKRSHIYNERHLSEIEAQERLFKAALAEMEREGITDEDDPNEAKGRPTLIRSTTTGRTYTEWIK
jgi:hypothetical protein